MASATGPTTPAAESSALIASLHALPQKLVRSSLYKAPADPSIQIRSWKMNEYKYYDVPSPFPTLARGLFTREIISDSPEQEGEEGKPAKTDKTYKIVVRGYDKFFNIGEVPWTTWPSLEARTAAPYTLSLKSNGCIIFIAALTPTQLLITSKHSLGAIQHVTLSHAQAGEAWLRKYLANKGKTEADLATRLWESNLTAIAELCDDSFEEHVLGYPPEKTGLHLHGLNERTKEFKTLSTEFVDAFAKEWGFIETPTIVLNTIQEVRDFTRTCGQTGEWNGEPVEGFVVRTHVVEPMRKENAGAPSPYQPGSSFFFKVKFDEPYMMYRDWREVTKTLLSSKVPMSPSIVPNSKMKRPETKVYVRWVIEEIKKDRESFSEFAKGKGIIATRERFLEFLKTVEGKKELASANIKGVVTINKSTSSTMNKTIIVPVAIPGCGKTSVSIALSRIFGFGHTQSDDIQLKKSAPLFLKNVTKLLATHDVVIADKNNHLKQHREGLREIASNTFQPARLIALNWSLDHPPATIHRICGDRVQERGENHQSLRANVSTKSHEDVIWMFINGANELTPSEVDHIVEMKVEESLEDSVKRAVNGLVPLIGLEMPSEEQIQKALDVVRGYVPSVRKADSSKGKKVDARYYGLLAEVNLEDLVERALENESETTKEFWTQLKANKRVAKRPHVTIVHKNNIVAEQELWDRCAALGDTANPPLFKGVLGNVLWNGRVMALTLDDIQAADAEGASAEASAFVEELPEVVRKRLHITVGTDRDIMPVEGKTMVQQWRKGEQLDTIKCVKLHNMVVYGRIKGLCT